MRLFELGPDVLVRAAEPEIHKDLNRYLNLMGSTRSKDVRRMSVRASGSGERELVASDTSEVPVWKSTYRIVLPRSAGKPFSRVGDRGQHATPGNSMRKRTA